MVKRLRLKLISSIKSKRLNVFLLFFFIAFIVLVLYKLSKVQTKTFSFKIHTVNLPKQLVSLNNDSLNLDITLRAQGYKLLSYYLKSPTLNLSFKKLQKLKDSVYMWDENSGYAVLNNQFTWGEEIVSVTPDTLLFYYDVNEVAKIPIELNTKISFAQGYDLLDKPKLSPDSITVIGPKTMISKLKELKTDTLVLNNINADIASKISLIIPKEFEKAKFSNKRVEVLGKVDKFTEGTVKVPVSIKNLPNNVQLKTFPKEATITFYTSLSNFNSVSSKDFKVECDYSKVNSERTYLEPILVKKPDFVKNARINQTRIEFILSE